MGEMRIVDEDRKREREGKDFRPHDVSVVVSDEQLKERIADDRPAADEQEIENGVKQIASLGLPERPWPHWVRAVLRSPECGTGRDRR